MNTYNCDCDQAPIRPIRELFDSIRASRSNLADNSQNETLKFLKICAPMVRYSQLPFRLLTRKYGCDIAFTPMIVAQSFAASEKARSVDFSTCPADRPLVVQFGATNSQDLVDAAGHVVRYADGIDINCGCPQKWAIKEGLGSALLNDPELLRDMIVRLKNAFPSGQLDHEVSVSVKIRIFSDINRTIDFARKIVGCGVDFVTIHGRTVAERSGDAPHWDIVKAVNELVLRPADCPLVVNGSIRNLKEASDIVQYTGAHGAMAAEGLLRNPALFVADCCQTPRICIADFLSFAKPARIEAEGDKGHNLKFDVYRKHVTDMLSGTGLYGKRCQAMKNFNTSKTGDDVNRWLNDNLLLNGEDSAKDCLSVDTNNKDFTQGELLL